MKVYKGSCASPGLVLGQVSRLEHHVETTTVGPFKPSRELQLLTDAIRTAQDELESMADRAAPSEQAIFQFQSMMLDDVWISSTQAAGSSPSSPTAPACGWRWITR